MVESLAGTGPAIVTLKRSALPPLPMPDALSRPFWQAAAQGRLVIQRCHRSGRWFHPPQPVCTCCGRDELEFREVSGRGVVESFVVMRDKRITGFEDRVPYVNLWVELDEQPGLVLVANLVGAEAGEVRIGARVRVVFERLTEDICLPQFELVDE
ncbi:OB-fold domain-containing protein [Dactylosporangium roseum]